MPVAFTESPALSISVVHKSRYIIKNCLPGFTIKEIGRGNKEREVNQEK